MGVDAVHRAPYLLRDLRHGDTKRRGTRKQTDAKFTLRDLVVIGNAIDAFVGGQQCLNVHDCGIDGYPVVAGDFKGDVRSTRPAVDFPPEDLICFREISVLGRSRFSIGESSKKI